MFRHTVIGAFVAAAVMVAALLCISSYRGYVAARADLETIERQERLLRVQIKERRKVAEYAGLVESFLNRTSRLGLDPDRWSYYTVEVRQPVAFAELDTMLDQAATSEAYYFKPRFLRIKTRVGEEQTELAPEFFTPPETAAVEEQQQSPVEAEVVQFAEDQEDEDVIVRMQGEFLVRRK